MVIGAVINAGLLWLLAGYFATIEFRRLPRSLPASTRLAIRFVHIVFWPLAILLALGSALLSLGMTDDEWEELGRS